MCPDLTIAKVECAWAFDLMAIGPFAPLRGLNVRAFFIGGIDPLGSILVTRDDERVDNSIVV